VTGSEPHLRVITNRYANGKKPTKPFRVVATTQRGRNVFAELDVTEVEPFSGSSIPAALPGKEGLRSPEHLKQVLRGFYPSLPADAPLWALHFTLVRPLGPYALLTAEAEVGVVLKRDVPPRSDGRPHTAEELWECVDQIVPCIELCARRYVGPAELKSSHKTLLDMADFMVNALVVTGQSMSPQAFEGPHALASLRADLHVNGAHATATGAAVLGNPLTALGWLAESLHASHTGLKKGQLVITGAICKLQAQKGNTVRASFGNLGSLELQLV